MIKSNTRFGDLLGCCVQVRQESRMVMLVAHFRRNEKKLKVGGDGRKALGKCV